MRFSRRDFLKHAGVLATGSWLAANGFGGVTRLSAQDAQTGAAQGKVDIMMGAGELSDDQIAQFQADNPGITINRIDFDPTLFFAMVASGEAPDLYRTDGPAIPQLLARNLLLSLQPYFDASPMLREDNLTSANRYYLASSPTSIGTGERYGMAKDASPDLTVFANKRLFEAAGLEVPPIDVPLTYEQVFELAQKLTTFDGDRTASWGYGWEVNFNERLWMVWLMGAGASLFTEDFTAANIVNNPEAREAIKYMIDFAKSRATISPLNPTDAWPGDDFGHGRLAMMQYGFWFSGMLDSWAVENPELAADMEAGNIVMLPAPTWKGKRLDPTITATGLVMLADTDVPDAAWKTFEWYMAGQPAIDRAMSGWGVPSLKSLFSEVPKEGAFREPVWKSLEEELKYMVDTVPFNPYLSTGALTGVFNQSWEAVLHDEMDFDSLVQTLEDEANFAIEEGMNRVG